MLLAGRTQNANLEGHFHHQTNRRETLSRRAGGCCEDKGHSEHLEVSKKRCVWWSSTWVYSCNFGAKTMCCLFPPAQKSLDWWLQDGNFSLTATVTWMPIMQQCSFHTKSLKCSVTFLTTCLLLKKHALSRPSSFFLLIDDDPCQKPEEGFYRCAANRGFSPHI